MAADLRRMTEARDTAIKLFGRTIPLPESQLPQAEEGDAEDPETEPAGDEKDIRKEMLNAEVKDPKPDVSEELGQGVQGCSSGLNNGNEDNHQTSTQEDNPKSDPKPEQHQSEADASGQEKVLKKPDKILPCPRCNSMDTKFCYFNNYNVNQPRHFCKNCQRYWTAGGTMRNVPVGAGRRKHKHSASHYRHLMTTTDGMTSNRVEALDSTHHQALPCGLAAPMRPLKVNGTVLKFGPETPLCESMASVLNLGDQKRNAELGTQCSREESIEEPSCASSVTASNSVENEFSEDIARVEQNGMRSYCNGVTPISPLQYYPGLPWAYPWSPGWNNAAAMAVSQCRSEQVHGQENGVPSPIPWRPPPLMATPSFCAPAIPFPFVPASFWGCMSGWPTGTWNVPWAGSNGGLSPSSSTSNSNCSGNGSPTLGKHSRDASSAGEEKGEKSLWIPKTLRIDDPDEAAKSSIWATLGIKPEEGGIFKAFPSKAENKGQTSDATQVLHVNPAALSRSQTFQEST